ncbi:MAG: DMT family transporter [Methanomassiliicoccales archaeon]
MIAIVGISFSSIFIRWSDAPAIVIAAYRMGFSSLILLPFVVFFERKELQRIDVRSLVVLSLVGLTLSLHFLFFISAVQQTTVASAVILVTSHPLIVCLLSALLFREKTLHSLPGVLLGFIGVIFIYAEDYGNSNSVGNALAFLGAVAAAAYIILGRIIRQKMSLLSYVFLVYFFSSLFLFLLCLVFQQPLWPYPIAEYYIFVALAIVSTIFGHTLFNYSIKYLPATYISVSFLGEPIGASILAALLLDESPTLSVVIGGAMILSGIMFVALKSRSLSS